jgi:hypothetical protein
MQPLYTCSLTVVLCGNSLASRLMSVTCTTSVEAIPIKLLLIISSHLLMIQPSDHFPLVRLPRDHDHDLIPEVVTEFHNHIKQ